MEGVTPKLGPAVREKGLRNVEALREILRLHKPADDATRPEPTGMSEFAQDGQVLRLPDALLDMAMARTGTEGPEPRLPYRDPD